MDEAPIAQAVVATIIEGSQPCHMSLDSSITTETTVAPVADVPMPMAQVVSSSLGPSSAALPGPAPTEVVAEVVPTEVVAEVIKEPKKPSALQVWDATRVDSRIGANSYAEGWRVEEAWTGGAAKSNWKYITPAGGEFSSLQRALATLGRAKGGAEVMAIGSKGLQTWPDAKVDQKFGVGFAAQGWRVEEAWPGGASKSNWKYISPTGQTYSSMQRARVAAGLVTPETAMFQATATPMTVDGGAGTSGEHAYVFTRSDPLGLQPGDTCYARPGKAATQWFRCRLLSIRDKAPRYFVNYEATLDGDESDLALPQPRKTFIDGEYLRRDEPEASGEHKRKRQTPSKLDGDESDAGDAGGAANGCYACAGFHRKHTCGKEPWERRASRDGDGKVARRKLVAPAGAGGGSYDARAAKARVASAGPLEVLTAQAVDRKLGVGASALGWRMEEAYAGGGKHSAWHYIAPDGEIFGRRTEPLRLLAECGVERAAGSTANAPWLARAKQTIPVGAAHQAELPPTLVLSVRPPPAEPPRCFCAQPAAWARKRWWCATEACDFECVPPPGPMTPLCECGRAAVWVRGCWLCDRSHGGCSMRLLDVSRPEPTPVAAGDIEQGLAARTAARLTAVARAADGADAPASDGAAPAAAPAGAAAPSEAEAAAPSAAEAAESTAPAAAAPAAVAAVAEDAGLLSKLVGAPPPGGFVLMGGDGYADGAVAGGDGVSRCPAWQKDTDFPDEDASCERCGSGLDDAQLLLCDNTRCTRAYHIYCLTPPLAAVPAGDWLCPVCSSSRHTPASHHGPSVKKDPVVTAAAAERQWWPEARVLGVFGQAAAGFRVVESYTGGGAKGNWRYIAPTGEIFTRRDEVQRYLVSSAAPVGLAEPVDAEIVNAEVVPGEVVVAAEPVAGEVVPTAPVTPAPVTAEPVTAEPVSASCDLAADDPPSPDPP